MGPGGRTPTQWPVGATARADIVSRTRQQTPSCLWPKPRGRGLRRRQPFQQTRPPRIPPGCCTAGGGSQSRVRPFPYYPIARDVTRRCPGCCSGGACQRGARSLFVHRPAWAPAERDPTMGACTEHLVVPASTRPCARTRAEQCGNNEVLCASSRSPKCLASHASSANYLSLSTGAHAGRCTKNERAPRWQAPSVQAPSSGISPLGTSRSPP